MVGNDGYNQQRGDNYNQHGVYNTIREDDEFSQAAGQHVRFGRDQSRHDKREITN